MQLKQITNVVTEDRDVPVTHMERVEVIIGETTEEVRTITAQDQYIEFDTPKLGVFKHRPGAVTDAFSTWLGREVDIAVDFCLRDSWGNIANPHTILDPCTAWVHAKPGRNLSFALPMYPENKGITLQQVANGAGDQYWRALANDLVRRGLVNTYIRPGWEMDLTGTKWGQALPGSGQEPYFKAAFRRIASIFKDVNDKFTIEVVTGQGWKDRRYLEAIWAGDDVCDRVGTDIYDVDWFNYADTYPYPAGATPAQRLRCAREWWNRYSWWLCALRDFALEHGKRMCIPEWSCATLSNNLSGMDNPTFVQKMYEFIMDPANAVDWHCIYSITSSWQIDPPTAMPLAGEEFRKLFVTKGKQYVARGAVE